MCRPLVNLLHSENHAVHTAALCALRSYALDARFAMEVDQRGGLPQVCRLVFGDKSEAVARALDLLWLLAGADSVKAKLAKERDGAMLRQLVACVKSKNGSVLSASVALLRKMAAVPEYCREIYDLSAHVDLVPMIAKVDDQTQLNAIGTIAALCLQEDQRAQIKTSGELIDRLQKLASPPKQGARAARVDPALAQRAEALVQVLQA